MTHSLHGDYEGKTASYYGADRPEMRRLVPASVMSVLDIGCGGGDFGRKLKEERPGISVTGIELTEWADAAEKVLDRVLRLDVERGDLDTLGTYDCLCFNDVLEHLANPWDACRRLLPFLRPGGFVVASSPNLRHYDVLKSLLLQKRFDYADWGVMDRTHLRFFTIHTFPELFASVGLRVVQSGGLEATASLPFKLSVLNRLLFNSLDDTRYLQLYCVSQRT
jgi:SAM-dependent methyltransferase